MLKREVSKKLSIKNGISRLSVEIFLLRVPKDFRCGKLRCIRKVRLSKNFMPKRVISVFSAFSRFTAFKVFKVRWGTPLCFRIFGTSKTFCSARGLRDFPLVFFGLPVLEIFVGNPFNRTENFEYRNFVYMRTENHVFLPKFHCLTIPKKFVVTTSKFQNIWDLEKFLSNLEFPLNFFVSQYRKTS